MYNGHKSIVGLSRIGPVSGFKSFSGSTYRARFGVTLCGSGSALESDIVDDFSSNHLASFYSENFGRVKTEAYEALDVLRSLGVDIDTSTSDISQRSNRRVFAKLYDDKPISDILLEHRLEELSASLGRNSNLARILITKLSNHTSLDPVSISSALKIASRGRGHKSIVYEGPRNGSGERLLLQVVNHELPDEMYWLSLNGSVDAVHGVGMAFAGYFLGPKSSDLAILSPAMRYERIDLSYRIDDRWLTVRSPDGSEVKARGSVDRAISRREKVELALRGGVV